MPYTFVDTIEPPATETMPAEALKLNGEYIENLMDARYCTYRTLYVRGREMLSPEVQSFETGVRDGSSFLSRRYPERILTIGFKLQAISNNYFRQAWNELNRILNVENAELIFYDEQDKYYIGTPAGIEEEPNPGSNLIKAEFNIVCNDPFKYSVKEYEIEATEDDGKTFVVDYSGTYKSFPTLEADFYEESECGDDGNTSSGLTGSGDCGYVAWINEDAQIIQLGDPDEEEGETYDKSQTLISQSFKNVSSWTTSLNALWNKNGGVNYDIRGLTGTTGFSNATDGYYLTPTSFGTRVDDWYGTSVYREIPADASGEVGAKDWTLKWTQEMHVAQNATASGSWGCIEVVVSDASGKIIACANMHGSTTVGKIWKHVNNKIVDKYDTASFAYNNSRWGVNGKKSNSITKTGSSVTFNLGGTVWSFTDSAITDMVATQLTITFATLKGFTAMPYIGIYDVSFIKNNCETWQDIPNKFAANDVAIAQCENGEVLMNGTPAPEYGALGNNWESFYLKPGINQIGFAYSDWCENPPTSKMRYREVYL